MNLKKFLKFGLILFPIFLVVMLFFYFQRTNSLGLFNPVNLEEAEANLQSDKLTPTSYLYITQAMRIQNEIDKLQAVPKDLKPIQSLKNSGWIPDWDLADGFKTVVQNPNTFYSVSPFWLTPLEDGHLKEVNNSVNPDLIDFTKNNHIQLLPTISLFDADLFGKIFNTKDNYKNFMDDLSSKIDKDNYDGVDLDFEEIAFKDKDLFYNVLKDIKQILVTRNKFLSFTALPKWGDEISYSGHPQTRQVQDYKQISDIADEFRIMTYDFYGRDASQAGPIAPLEWMERVVQYAIFSGVPREKIVLGVPTYAYDWSDREITSQVNLTSDFTGIGSLVGLEPGDAYYYQGVEKVMKSYDLKYSFNDEWGEALGRYTFEGKSRIVVFPTDKSIELRKELAAEYGIRGISFWRIGDEGSLKL